MPSRKVSGPLFPNLLLFLTDVAVLGARPDVRTDLDAELLALVALADLRDLELEERERS